MKWTVLSLYLYRQQFYKKNKKTHWGKMSLGLAYEWEA